MGWLIALGILVLIAILPVGIRIEYDSDGFYASAIIGCIHIPVFPVKKKAKKEKKAPKPTEEKKAEKTTEKKPELKKKKGGNIGDFLPVLDRVLDFLSAFRRKLRINQLELVLTLGGGDPCDLAVNYGRGWALLGNLVPVLENAFIIKKRNLEVECDFLAENTAMIARVDISITVGRMIALLGARGIPIAWEFIKVINKRKGGAKA